MAKFFPSFSICPLIDQRCFLGVTEDNEANCIIVTLGKNIVLRFRLTDQRQLSSWTTQDKFSTPAVYDKEQERYVAVFNGEVICTWPDTHHSGNLKRLKKYKLVGVIYSLHSIAGMRPVLILKDKSIYTLDKNEKNSVTMVYENAVSLDEELIESNVLKLFNDIFITLQTKLNSRSKLHFLSLSKKDDNFYVNLFKKDCSLSSFSIVEEKDLLVSLWSDGNLYVTALTKEVRQVEELPGKSVFSFTNINPNLPSSMIAISSSHVALYAADLNGEGAKLCLIDVSFGVLQATIHLKLYTDPPRMWKLGNSYLIMPVGQNLTVVPLQLTIARLDSLIGAHIPCDAVASNSVWEDIRISDTDSNMRTDETSAVIERKLKDGVPETLLCEEIISPLLEKGKIKIAVDTLCKLNDVPDVCVLNTLLSCMKSSLNSKNKLLMKILKFPLMNDNTTLSLIKDNISFDEGLSLLEIIVTNLENESSNDHLINWIILLLDSFYQQYLLSTKNEKVLNQIFTLKKIVTDMLKNLIEMQDFHKFLTGVLQNKVSTKSSVHYSVERFRLY